MLTCYDIANYFLAHSNPEETGEITSNLKIQKLIYYAQGFHLAVFDKPLFAERIMAWTHGPVVPELYHAYKQYGAEAIPVPQDVNFEIYEPETRELLDEVYAAYGQFSAWKLSVMTHEEPPWKEASETAGEITHEALKNYFRTLVNGEDKK